jgi:hypothetical protein
LDVFIMKYLILVVYVVLASVVAMAGGGPKELPGQEESEQGSTLQAPATDQASAAETSDETLVALIRRETGIRTFSPMSFDDEEGWPRDWMQIDSAVASESGVTGGACSSLADVSSGRASGEFRSLDAAAVSDEGVSLATREQSAVDRPEIAAAAQGGPEPLPEWTNQLTWEVDSTTGMWYSTCPVFLGAGDGPRVWVSLDPTTGEIGYIDDQWKVVRYDGPMQQPQSPLAAAGGRDGEEQPDAGLSDDAGTVVTPCEDGMRRSVRSLRQAPGSRRRRPPPAPEQWELDRLERLRGAALSTALTKSRREVKRLQDWGRHSALLSASNDELRGDIAVEQETKDRLIRAARAKKNAASVLAPMEWSQWVEHQWSGANGVEPMERD